MSELTFILPKTMEKRAQFEVQRQAAINWKMSDAPLGNDVALNGKGVREVWASTSDMSAHE
ncbi:MAG: hypothetical protein ABJ246_05860 [Paracoccaceae bacterium]